MKTLIRLLMKFPNIHIRTWALRKYVRIVDSEGGGIVHVPRGTYK